MSPKSRPEMPPGLSKFANMAGGLHMRSGGYRHRDLSVTVTGAEGTASANATRTVTVGGEPTLEVLSGSTVIAEYLGYVLVEPTTAQWLVTPKQPPEAKVREWARQLGTVFPYGRSGTSNTWTLRARHLKFGGPPPPTITARLKSMASEVEETVELEQTEPGRGDYEGSFDLSDTLIVPDDRRGIRTRFSSVDAVTGLDITSFSHPGGIGNHAFTEFMRGFQEMLPYPLARLRLGEYTTANPEFPLTFGSKEFASIAWATSENVRNFGFEAVNVSLTATPAVQSSPPLFAIVKVRNPATTVMLNVHGNHHSFTPAATASPASGAPGFPPLPPGIEVPGGSVLLSDGPMIPGAGFTESDARQIKTLMLLSCGALDLHDYNNWWSVRTDRPAGFFDPGRRSPDDPVEKRFSSGRQWFQATGQGRTILLGYSTIQYEDDCLEALEQYKVELQRLAGLVDDSQLQQLAWLTANAVVARTPPELPHTAVRRDESTVYACAWDQFNYYYIGVNPRSARDFRVPPFRRIRGFYRIPRNEWDTNPISWRAVPPSTARPITDRQGRPLTLPPGLITNP